MRTDLKSEIRTALAGTSSKNPMETSALAKKIHRRLTYVEAALMEMYQECEVYCCKIIKRGHESVLWWISGVIEQPAFWGKKNEPATEAAKPEVPLTVVTADVLKAVRANPGITQFDLVELLRKHEQKVVRNCVTRLSNKGHLRHTGLPRHFHYYVVEQQ